MSVRGGLVVLVEPFGKGGGVDVIARLLADPFASAVGARVVVDNRPGWGPPPRRHSSRAPLRMAERCS